MKKLILLISVAAVGLSGCVTSTLSEHGSKYKDLSVNELNQKQLDPTLAGEVKNKLVMGEDAENSTAAVRLKNAKLALALLPDDRDALLQLAQAQFELGQYEKSLGNYEKLLAGGSDAELQQGIGLSQVGLGRFETAKENLNAALTNDPALWRSWNGLGMVETELADGPAAITAFSKAHELNRDDLSVANNLALAYIEQGQFSDALDVYETSGKASPQYLGHRIAIAFERSESEALISAGDRERAHLFNAIGENALKNAERQKAASYFKKAIAVSPVYFEQAERNLESILLSK